MHLLESPRPCRRVTATSRARLVVLGQLLEYICGFECTRHHHRPAVQQVVNGRVSYSGCCEDLLDSIEKGLRSA